MKITDIINEDGRIVKGVNTTVDVQPGETERQAAKFFGYNKDLVKKRKAKNPVQTLYNMGLAEGVNEDFGSVPPLVDLIVMAVLAKTTVDVLTGAFKTAIKTGKGLKKLNDLRKRAAQMGQSVADYAMPNEHVKEDRADSVIAAALEAMHRLVMNKGSRHSLGNYAFQISRAYELPISIRELEKLYAKTY